MSAPLTPPSLGSLDVRNSLERNDPGLKLVIEISTALPPQEWMLVGGQMVLLHTLHARVDRVRVTRDVDLLVDVVTRRSGINIVVQTLKNLGFRPEPTMSEMKQYRYVRSSDDATVDVLAPDHSDPRHSLRTEGGHETVRISGGSQALQRRTALSVITPEFPSGVQVPLPTILGALVLKAAAWVVDRRDSERHLQDAVLLVSLIADPLVERNALKGSDRKRLNKLNVALERSEGEHWAMLGARAQDALTKWQLLLET